MVFGAIWPSGAASNFGAKLKNKCGKGNQDKVIGDMARNARDIARTLAAHGKTGNLARTIFARKASDGVWEVGSPLDYAWAVEFGSGVFSEGPSGTKGVIEPTQSEFLVFKIGGEWKRVRFVLGQHPQPFLRPAISQVDGKKEFHKVFG